MPKSTNMRRRITVFALASCIFVLHERPAIAQSSSTLERVSVTSVHHYVAGEAIPRQLALPPNLIVSGLYRPLVEAMLRDSPTFRRQCVRIAAEYGLTVHLSVSPPPRRSDHRAMTRLTRDAKGDLTAVVAIGPFEDTQELIAHEFEHIIEQLDGVDLAARAAFAHTGVIRTGHRGTVFETTRAQRMGVRVASELRP
jgi:hypothetical protein